MTNFQTLIFIDFNEISIAQVIYRIINNTQVSKPVKITDFIK